MPGGSVNWQTILLDAGGTLIDPQPSVGHIYARLARKRGKRIPPESLQKRFNATWKARGGLKTLLPPPGRDGRTFERLWWRNFVEEVFEPFGPFPAFDEYFAELYEAFEKPSNWRVYPDAREALPKLKEAGVKLAVISNWDSRLRTLLSNLGLATHLDDIVISSEVRRSKPDPGIFRLALRRVGGDPERTVCVGDHPVEDCAGATAAGLSALLLDRSGGRRGLRTIRSLTELLPPPFAKPAKKC